MNKLTFVKKFSNRSQSESVAPNSPTRRQFLGLAGSSLGFAMIGGLSGCGGGDSSTTVANGDQIWGNTGSVGNILTSLQNITQNAFKNVDYDVVAYGAAQCTVISQTNPYVVASSPVSPGADKTHAPSSFDSRPAFLAAIVACNAAGGGRVVVPSGNWYCAGPIVLLSNVNFHLSADCTIYFSPDPADYAKDGPVDCGTNGKLYNSRWQADDCLNFGSPIYAYQQTNIALTGADPKTSILNGQAMTPFVPTTATVPAAAGVAFSTNPCWWSFKGTKNAYGTNAAGTTASQGVNNPLNLDLKTVLPTIDATLYSLLTTGTGLTWQQDQNYLPALSEASIPLSASLKQRVFGLGHFLRPCMIEFIGCTNVLMENYQTNNTPFWQHHPVACTNVVIRGVFVNSIGPNNDGFDPEACNTVLCDGMTFNTGDDCIAIKSGKNLDTQYGPANNHVIQNCTMNSGHGGITLGSEMGAGIQNIYARNLTMLNANWATNPLNIAIRIKTNMNRGGFIKNFYVDGVSLPNGVNTKSSGSANSVANTIPGSPVNNTVPIGVVVAGGSAYPSNNQGGIITFDCDYTATGDAIRTRPPQVQNINISNVQASNVTVGGVTASCFQAIVAQGPVVQDYNGPAPTPTMYPISGVTISNCNFGTPVAAGPASATVAGPIYAFNVNSITLQNVLIASTAYNTVITDAR
ncbi:MAG: glycoside hydrolase family 28 protein [Formivibrio sp.]|nr:glycoside hydrolase family 28 protein [Formivibrio sp.]